jgi:O-antigen ligase
VVLAYLVTLAPNDVGLSRAALVGVGAAALGALIAAGPLACIGVIGGLAFTGATPTVLAVGEVNIRLDDVFFLILVISIVYLHASGRRDSPPVGSINWRPAILFFGLTGLSVWRLGVTDPDQAWISLVSWLRILQTASLVWIVSLVVTTPRHIDLLIRAFVYAGVLSAGLALQQSGAAGALAVGTRHGGLLNENAFGLLSGFLIVFALFSSLNPPLKIAAGAAGMIGLYLSKSIGSTLGISVAVIVGVAWVLRSSGRSFTRRQLVAFGALAIVPVVAVLALRSDSLPTSSEFRSSSAYHRIILGAAGVRIFLDHPIIGVGWQKSASPQVIGDDEVAVHLRRAYPDVNTYLYPEAVPSNVHNAYIQLLAELGVIGLIAFAVAVFAIGGGVLGFVRSVAPESEVVPNLRALTLCLMFVLVWWNDNAIFGGQTESVTAALFLGMIAGLARAGVRPSGSRPPPR